MKRVAIVAAALAASPALAADAWENGIDGVGRVSLSGGWRLVQNDWFFSQSALNGNATISRGIGGPQGTASFGYGATRHIEASIDLFIGHDSFAIDGYRPIGALAYGALLGIRYTWMDLGFAGFAPYLGVGVGPTLGYVYDGELQPIEKLSTGIAGSAGATLRLTDRFGITLEYRFLYARANWYSSGVNVGGHWFSLGVVLYFPRSAVPDTSGMPMGR